MNKYSNFKDRLKEAIEKRDLTPAELSRLSGVDQSSISRYLKGQKVPKVDKLRRLAGVLYVNSEWLLGYDCPETPQPVALSMLENELILDFRALSAEDKFFILEFVKAKRTGKNGDAKI